jgi:hypothetical protein
VRDAHLASCVRAPPPRTRSTRRSNKETPRDHAPLPPHRPAIQEGNKIQIRSQHHQQLKTPTTHNQGGEARMRALTPMHRPIKNPWRRDDGDLTGDETAQVTAAELLHCG